MHSNILNNMLWNNLVHQNHNLIKDFIFYPVNSLIRLLLQNNSESFLILAEGNPDYGQIIRIILNAKIYIFKIP